MPNERNVKALEKVVREAIDEVALAGFNASRADLMAAALASRGVLVPSVLTDQEWETAVDPAYCDDYNTRDAAVSELEKIARGDPG